MDDIIGYMQNLLTSEPLREPVLKNALLSLDLPAHSKGSPDFILNIPEYYAFFTYTMIYATVL